MNVFDRVTAPRRRTSRPRRRALTIALAATLLLAVGCDSGSEPGGGAKKHAAPGPSVIAPGKPGEAAETLSAEEAAKKRSDDSPNAADFTYVQMMINHHGQALEMTELAAKHATSGRVKRIAGRIGAAQGPEIEAMKGWLKSHGGAKRHSGSSSGSGSGHGHEHGQARMPGMATEVQMKQLHAARGAAFDELFLKLMITHHDGAITMATEVLSDGNNVQIEEMAGDVIAQQTSEISRMRGML